MLPCQHSAAHAKSGIPNRLAGIKNREIKLNSSGEWKVAKKFDVKALRQKALASDDVKYDTVYVEAWDAEIPVKTLTGADLKKVMKAGKDDQIRMTILAVLYGCETPEGEKVFEEADLAIFEQKKGIKEIAQLAKRILELSGLTDEMTKQVKND